MARAREKGVEVIIIEINYEVIAAVFLMDCTWPMKEESGLRSHVLL